MDLQEHWIYRSWNIGSTGVGTLDLQELGPIQGFNDTVNNMDVSGISIPVQSPRRKGKEHREAKMNEARAGFIRTAEQVEATSVVSRVTSPTITQLPQHTESMDMETDQETGQSLEQTNEAIKAAARLVLKERAEEKAKEIISSMGGLETPENYDDDDETYTLRPTTGEDEFNREPLLFDLDERVREFQEAIDPNKKVIMYATIINNFPVRTTEAEFMVLSLTMLQRILFAHDPKIPWVTGIGRRQ